MQVQAMLVGKRTTLLAAIGGLVAIAGSTAIFFTIKMAFEMLANMMNPEQTLDRATMPVFLPNLRQVLITYVAGFISVLVLAPFATRRFRSSGFPTIGFTYGAGAGFLCFWLVAFIHISVLTISGMLSGGFENMMPWTLKLLGYYSSLSMLLFGLPATAIGAISGSCAELLYRRFQSQRSTALATQ